MEPDHPYALRAYRHLTPYLTDQPEYAEERAFLTVAAMVCDQGPEARHLDLTSDPVDHSVGKSMAHAVVTGRFSSDQAAESRLILLSRQNLTGVHRLLPQTISALRRTKTPVGWARLIEDLAGWPTRHRITAKHWIQDYHRTRARLDAQRRSAKTDDSESETP